MPKPAWLKTPIYAGEVSRQVDSVLGRLRLNTVCAAARCPNLGECWGRGTATFMILGNTCTRHCRFCAVKTGNPQGILDPTEPERLAQAVQELGLEYVVITSVDRDDLPDLGAGAFVSTVQLVREMAQARIELLTPDFDAREELLRAVQASAPDVWAHNVETVEALTPQLRDPRASYRQSLRMLNMVKTISPRQVTKSGLMLGLGEKPEQVIQTMRDLREVGVDLLTIGQYLQPTRHNLPVVEYVRPEQFAEYQAVARSLGFRDVLSGPLVRSSYRAEQQGNLGTC